MSITPAPLGHHLPADALRAPPAGGDDERRPSGAPAWLISASVHAVFALIFWAVVFASSAPETELPPLLLSMPDIPPKKDEQKVVERAIEPKPEINVVEADKPAPIDLLTVHDPETATDTDVTSTTAKGTPDAVATIDLGSPGAFIAMGAGAHASGALGARTGSGKIRALLRGGGGPATERSVESALNWFKRHQSPNGMWDVERYQLNCSEAPKCEPGSTGEAGGSDANVATTGYALLCFLGAGYDHKAPNKFRTTVQKGLDYLRSVQKADGLMGNRNYENAVATMALAEAYAMTMDPELKPAAQNGIKAILARQNRDARAADAQYAGLGWDYTDPRPERNDSSVSGWNVMALKSGLAAGLNVGNGMDGAKKWVERAWKAANRDWARLSDPYADTSSFPYTWDAASDQVVIDPPGSQNHDLAPVGALCAVYLGHHAGDLMLETMCNHLMKYQLPTAYPCNTYYLYYGTMAIFQAGGPRWDAWNAAMVSTLVGAQRRAGGCMDGSWDWEGTKFHGNAHGRLLSTAYCCLCLEVYYRYQRSSGEAMAAPGKKSR